MQPTSDDELQLMQDVEFLHSQLRAVGEPVDARFANLFDQGLRDKSLAERFRKWQLRKVHLEKLLQNANSRAIGAGAEQGQNANSGANGAGAEQEQNANFQAIGARAQRPNSQKVGGPSGRSMQVKEYLAERKIDAADIVSATSGAAADSAAPSQNVPHSAAPPKPGNSVSRKRKRAPRMTQIHVSFARLSAVQLVRNDDLTHADLIANFNAAWPTIAPTFGLEQRGRANNFF